ncbi:MAG: hypothetical protein NC930_08715 [Candidatus Omnitrophica bacterium]|nr:hypothetical protein [Candidatus Omnitrophota bacterium]
MKKRTRSKIKSSSKSSRAKSELPELVAVMLKIAERLEVLEKKVDTMIHQTSSRISGAKPASQNFQRPEPPHPAPPQESPPYRRQKERVLHKAICADCRKDCEVPFRPSGDRPVYCKECFAKRKSGGSLKTNITERSSAPHPQRVVRVIRHGGVGRVTISEPALSSKRDFVSKRRMHQHAKKSKKSSRR